MLNPYRKSTQHQVLGTLFLVSLVFCLSFAQIESIIAQTPDASQLVQQGIERYKAADFRGAIAPWKTALNFYQQSKNQNNEAIVSENLARAYQQLGDSEEALSYWEQVTKYYRNSGNLQQYGRMLTEQAQTYSNLGQPGKAIALLCGIPEKQPKSDTKPQEQSNCLPGSALQIARQQTDKLGEVAALGSLGEAYRLRGKYDDAIKHLEQAEKITEPVYKSKVLNSLGNAYLNKAQREKIRADSAKQLGISKANEFQKNAIAYYKKAWDSFQSSLRLARQQDDKVGQMQVLLNLIQLDRHLQDEKNLTSASPKSTRENSQSETHIQAALNLLDKLPLSRNKIYAAIDLANLPENSKDASSSLIACSSKRRLPESQANSLLLNAVETSQKLQDSRSQSFAFGSLGHFYECRQEYKQALDFTQKALWSADQKMQARDSVYLWEWQRGRILKAQDKESEALPSYQRAYTLLEQIRSDILSAERDLQFDFQDVIKPLYLELAQLRLEEASLPSSNTENRKEQLKNALETIDSLKLAELQNFFGNDCILTVTNDKNVDELLGKSTAVFSSIFLDKNIAILLSLPSGERKLQWIKESRENVITEIQKFRQGLEEGILNPGQYDSTHAQNLYDWFIRPFKDNLKQEQIKTLVFVQDGILRIIPMAALYDKEQKKFLVENYDLANTPSLKLTAPKALNQLEKRALILGLTKQVEVDGTTYSALPNVQYEIDTLKKQFPDNKPLINEEFNREKLDRELNKTVYPIVHIATHAQFGTIPEDTFIVTGNGYKLTINELEASLRQINGGSRAVELLALTACQTALGDERASLGLAGVAVQAGVRSALATLWSVSDASTSKLMTEFYSGIKSGMSKAQALSAAQRKLIQAKKIEDINDQYDNPAYWAPFITIGNWL
ncbi:MULTISPECIES: CHAT domain-containing protein [Nostocales]|uniref:CHAT domain-containing protein n=3 Tax=Nostocales TaxID=1161 RepID=A0A8S9TAX8_9CYAN|nr:CHAT domain-containing protein [Tolypothrix bouteillei]KAF3889316.1 CHAT domain-containing protein [Tolypothrix bouteillei VB521301]